MLSFVRPSSVFSATPPLVRHHDPFDALFSDVTTALARSSLAARSLMTPTIQEHESCYSMQLATPGVRRDQLQVSVVGERKIEVAIVDTTAAAPATATKTDDDSKPESTTKDAEPRSLVTVGVPGDSDMAAISTSYENGLLCVTIPKRTATTVATAEGQIADASSAEIALLADTVAEQTAKVRGMEEELSRERRALAEKHVALRAAKEEEARRRASLRRTLTIA
jgi:HSP20 family molecular chaperone IbpA